VSGRRPATVKEYAFGEFTFEFESKKGLRGHLRASTESETLSADIDLGSQKSRRGFVEEANELYEAEFPEFALRRALNELTTAVGEDVAAAKAAADEAESDHDGGTDAAAGPEVTEEEISSLIGQPGVLNRYVEAMAEIGAVYEDRQYMKTVTLGGLSAQLDLSFNRPLGTNVVLTGDSGRGKNYVPDAVAQGMPDDFVYPFESASAKSFYYQAESDPDRFRHTWVYPNEAEAVDMLIETLRPLLSKGSAEHGTVDSTADGANTFRSLHVQGPITVTIPTVRNKLDGQLQTRLLTVEMEDYEGRVAGHTEKFADTLLPDYVGADHTSTLRKWKAALKTLTAVRRVVLPGKVEGFKYDTDAVSHGSRVWRNLISFMLTHAWLEQRNRQVMTLKNDESAVVVTAEDYRVAYELFEEVAQRSVVNLSDSHRKICDAVYKLQTAKTSGRLQGKGFSVREIANKGGLNHQTVQKHKTFLITSEGLLREGDKGGLLLVEGAEPSWWHKSDLLRGLPKPVDVEEWWSVFLGSADTVDTVDSGVTEEEKVIDTPKEAEPPTVDVCVDASTQTSTPIVDSGKPVDTPSAAPTVSVSTVSTPSRNGDDPKKGETQLGSYMYID